MASRTLSVLWILVGLLGIAALPASAQSFRVQCPTSTITHPDPTNSGLNNTEPAYNGPTQFTLNAQQYVTPKPGTVNGAIKCQQISGGDGYMTEADGTQTFMFSFGPLSGLADVAAGKPSTQFPSVFNTTFPGCPGITTTGVLCPAPLVRGDPATTDGATSGSSPGVGVGTGTAFTWNGAVGLTPEIAQLVVFGPARRVGNPRVQTIVAHHVARDAGHAACYHLVGQLFDRLQRRPETEQDPRENRDEERESQHRATHVHFFKTRKTLRPEPPQKFDTGRSQKNPGCSAGEGEKKAFRQQLPYQPGASRSNGGPYDNLSLPYAISREKQARYIRARYQQNERHRGQKHQQGKADTTDENALKRLKAQAPSGIRNWVFASKTCGDGIHLSLRLRDGYAALKKSHGAEEMRAAGLHSLILKGSREPKIGSREYGDLVREHTDDGARLVVECDGFSNYVWIAAKPFLPQMTAENYHQRIRGLLVG